jgi:hypothetical protein
MAAVNGTDLFVFMNGALVAHAISHTLDAKMITRKTSDKDSGVFETAAPGRLDITASCEGMVVYGSIELLRAAIVARNPLDLDFGEKDGTVVDDTVSYATGMFYLTSLSETAPDQGNATYTASFEHASGFAYVTAGALTARIAHSDCTTYGGDEGFAAVLPLGGTPPYTYLWSTSGTDQYIEAQEAGTYTVTVTDAASGTALASVTITEPAA